jgi:hypothetical protein
MKKVDNIYDLLTKLIRSNGGPEEKKIRAQIMEYFKDLPPEIKKNVMKVVMDSIEELENV